MQAPFIALLAAFLVSSAFSLAGGEGGPAIGKSTALDATVTPRTNAVSVTNLGLSALLPLNDPVSREYRKLLEMDDAAQAEVELMMKENEAFKAKGAGFESVTLRARILQKFEPVKKAYEDFLKRNPGHAQGHLAYGSFLNDIGEEDASVAESERARELNPGNPASWNNLANYYGHNGDVRKAFDYYAKAIELNPNESIYHQNFATSVYLFRQDAMAHYKITEQQVFEKAMGLYHRALELDPENFALATDVAQTYYGIKPLVTGDAGADKKAADTLADQAIADWLKALNLAGDETQREGVYIHLARLQINAGRFEGARKNLDAVTNEAFSATKKLLLKKMTKMEGKGEQPNATKG